MSSVLLSERSLPSEVAQALKVLDKHFVFVNQVVIKDGIGRTYVNLGVINIGIGITDDMSTLTLHLEDDDT